ncbi:hypothetical protein D3C77_202300 [compost metagenome]
MVGKQHVLGQTLEQAQGRGEVFQAPGRRRGLLDHPDGKLGVLTQVGVSHRLGQAVVRGEPLRTEAVQGVDVRLATLQACTEELAEQRLKAIPGHAVFRVDPVDQQVLVFHALQQFTGLRMAGHGHGHGGIESAKE